MFSTRSYDLPRVVTYELPENLDELQELRFETAWAHPSPVINALSEKFPDAEIIVKYADEDMGWNLGDLTIKNGRVLRCDSPDEGTDEAKDFASQLIHGKTYEEIRKGWELDDEDDVSDNTDDPASNCSTS